MSTDELVQLISAGVLQRLALNLKKNLYARLNGCVSPFEVQGYFDVGVGVYVCMYVCRYLCM